MAREYAKLLTRIWADSDFKALSGQAQRLYFQLISQPDMSMAGVVTLAEKRWSLQVGDQGERDIESTLAELEQRRFVVVDRGTQEVLIRSFIRSDGGWKSPTTMKSIDSSVRATLSDGLKAVMRDEVSRLDMSKLSSTVSPKTGKSTQEVVEGIAWGIQNDFEALSHAPADTPSHTPSDAPTDGHNGIPHTTEPAPEPEPAPAPAPATLKRGSRRTYPPEFEDFWSVYPKAADKPAAFKAWERAAGREDTNVIAEGALRYRDDPNRDDTYTKNASTWLNADAWDNDPLPPRQGPRPSRAQEKESNNLRILTAFASGDDYQQEITS